MDGHNWFQNQFVEIPRRGGLSLSAFYLYKMLATPVPEFIDPRIRENKPKTLLFSHWKWAFWACFHENWVYKFGHWSILRSERKRKHEFSKMAAKFKDKRTSRSPQCEVRTKNQAFAIFSPPPPSFSLVISFKVENLQFLRKGVDSFEESTLRGVDPKGKEYHCPWIWIVYICSK